MRLLDNIASKIFFLKIGRFDLMTRRNIAVMCFFIHGKPMNLLFMMIKKIKEAAKRARAYLPYGMVFTLLSLDSIWRVRTPKH